jgi:glycosyltransferase involved in cell wall biosynthesis
MVPVLESYGISTPIQTIPVGINHAVFAQAKPTGTIRHRFSITAHSKVILYVGRIGVEKSVDLLVPMLKALQERFDTHLILCGQGTQEASMKRAAGSLGISDRIHFAGVIRDPSELANFYGDADVFAFPSQTDTFGLVVVEAQAAGLPVVAVAVLGSTATIEDGVSGLLSTPDPVHLANQVGRILSNPVLAGRLRAGARRSSLAYTADSIATRYLDAYRVVVSGRAAAAAA